MTVDFYDIDALLTEDERMVRDNVRAFVDARVPWHFQRLRGGPSGGAHPEFRAPSACSARRSPSATAARGMGDTSRTAW